MVEVYQSMGVSPRQSTTLHSHFVELYSALKQGIRDLLLCDGSPKCPTLLAEGAESEVYVKTLFEVLSSDSKKFQPKKWWSLEVMKSLLSCHLEYMKDLGSRKQNASWLEVQKAVKKSSILIKKIVRMKSLVSEH
jgi:hypothetical protein